MIAKGGNRKAEGGNRFHRSRCAHNFPLPPSPLRLGFTLIELLITIAIIATLSAMFLGASRAAMEQSRASRTKTTISKLHTLLMEQWNSYEARRVDLNSSVVSSLAGLPVNTPLLMREKTKESHLAKLYAMRELCRLEMPDRWTDVWLNSLESGFGAPASLKDRPTLSKIYLRKLQALKAGINKNSGQTNTITEITNNQSAECLYMIIMYACGDGESRTMFAAQDIGDVDGDGAPEFLDGWGQPIQFVRWSTGFYSPLQPIDNELTPPGHNALADHDPFDIFNVEPTAYRFVPLILSRGADGEAGINTMADDYLAGTNNPFYRTSVSDPLPGEVRDTAVAADNIHNHLQEAR